MSVAPVFGRSVVLGAVLGVLCAGGVAEAELPPYSLVGSFPLPFGAHDVMPDGRMLVLSGETLLRQDAVNGGTFSSVGTLPAGSISTFGGSLLRMSPDGARVAVGNGEFGAAAAVHFFSAASLAPGASIVPTSVAVANFDAEWTSPTALVVSGFDASAGSVVSRVDAIAHTRQLLVTEVGDGSGGIAYDGVNVYIGCGFDAGIGEIGNVRSFNLNHLESIDFPPEFQTGILVADALSGGPLGFDPLGNLLVAGGDFFGGSGDAGYSAVIDGDAIAAALLGGSPAPDSAELRLSPAGAGEFYSTLFNTATSELLVIGGGRAYRYAVPAPGTGLPVLAAAALARRRRR